MPPLFEQCRLNSDRQHVLLFSDLAPDTDVHHSDDHCHNTGGARRKQSAWRQNEGRGRQSFHVGSEDTHAGG